MATRSSVLAWRIPGILKRLSSSSSSSSRCTGGTVVKNPPANAGGTGDAGSIPWLGDGNPLQYSRLENSMDRGAWRATVHGVAKSQAVVATHSGKQTHSEGQCR